MVRGCGNNRSLCGQVSGFPEGSLRAPVPSLAQRVPTPSLYPLMEFCSLCEAVRCLLGTRTPVAGVSVTRLTFGKAASSSTPGLPSGGIALFFHL